MFDWYKIFNKVEFEALDLVSREYVLNLQDIGERTITAFKGNMLSILYDGVFLSIGMADQNPFKMDGYAVYLDQNNDVWLGIEVPVED